MLKMKHLSIIMAYDTHLLQLDKQVVTYSIEIGGFENEKGSSINDIVF